MARLALYYHTLKYMKPTQILRRIGNKAGFYDRLGCKPAPLSEKQTLSVPPKLEALDFDPDFLSRFPEEELMQDRLTLLHQTVSMKWDQTWQFPDHSPLWNYNLQYFEFLFPLVRLYTVTGEKSCYEKIRQVIRGWIKANPAAQGGAGWSAYTISLRLTNWLQFWQYLQEPLAEDADFRMEFLSSIHEQYAYLANHLETDLLGNHYFENLKTLVLCAAFFREDPVRKCAVSRLKQQCAEQILPDGMHFELSPMYHKIILEDLLRVTWTLRTAEQPEPDLERDLQPMLDCAYSLENGLQRLPLFNDCGTNVSKSLDALCRTALETFGLKPVGKIRFPDAGYYMFEQNGWRLLVDAGQPGPDYLPGHAHCDAMSFELFNNGVPVLVNCGTYAYQCEERLWFKSTQAHNTVMVQGTEQSQCWSAFRMGRRASVTVEEVSGQSIRMTMKDQRGHLVTRTIAFDGEQLRVTDQAPGQALRSYLHGVGTDWLQQLETQAEQERGTAPYGEEFGEKSTVSSVCLSGYDQIIYTIQL